MVWMILPAGTFLAWSGLTTATSETAPPDTPPRTITPENFALRVSAADCNVSPSASPRSAMMAGMPLMVSALDTSSPAIEAASRWRADLSDFSASFCCARSDSSFFSTSATGDPSLAAIDLSRSRSDSAARCASVPATASMRRIPAATAPSPVIRKRPISPVPRTCVPPHSSML